ncbi:MAG: carboxylating nicotinate-nucleotide diphosphorylase [Desulfurivibrionaceae bacterium]|nr:carboxylating nicotinate-nucleotide diphosphorylase [Desulfobulbales bacterium]MDT8334495.1 carboxylating nicotinate-nucleotide diphosphorylase [Desulfurivibrionaceae bacterium]
MDHRYLENIVGRFLAEDIGQGDITSEPIFAPDRRNKAFFVAKDEFIAAGLATIAPTVFKCQNENIVCAGIADGTVVKKGDTLLTAEGPILDLLKAERVALNLVQRLCGIATLTGKFVQIVKDLPVAVVDTRKTTPGLRALEKYAVRVGGGHNHRMSLADGILIKDNHIAACGSIMLAVEKVRGQAPHTLKVEVECENLKQVGECLDCGVEIIMLDNMAIAEMIEAVKLVNGKAILEASGGVGLGNIRVIAETGVNIISVGALTHSAPACDISMRLISA